ALVLQLVEIFLEHTPVRMGQIQGGLDETDLEVAERGAHSLKSSAGNLGARRLERVAARIEEHASRGEAEEATDLLVELESTYQEARTALRALKEKMEE
ncbi:MAG: hypothetical protein GWM92_04680, partial [Gemmatimonadetes bacterium]|nr:Hpt domain-containing protein [Gemmatimonadota bacterium]NIR77869.1 Hpt domain-containing protein [Gemmatimonadota bacterium]NIT86414.1 Hpt domain-containing protein [Gemmatimonadota bacterium]NIU30251.1 Hpt domain-containing protein [Gemmatimonadota bacterium]NIU35157.1 hypothetical protein [Gemmatimonadota bacterium]